jgi:hypothetical protein
MYHFAKVASACAAVDQGIQPEVTAGDPLQVAGVWLSPNVYGSGSPGSFFGPIGLRITATHLAGCQCAYIGPKPGSKNRRRFLLLPVGVALPRE